MILFNKLYFQLLLNLQRQKAHSLYENKLGELMHNEKQAELVLEEEKQKQIELQLHKAR